MKPETCAGSPTSTVSSGLPARMDSRWATWEATAFTSHPGRSVGVDHSSSDSSSRSSVNSLIACHQTSTYALSSSWSVVMRSTLEGASGAQAYGEHGDVVGQLLADQVTEHAVEELLHVETTVLLHGRSQSIETDGEVLAATLDEPVGVEQEHCPGGDLGAVVGPRAAGFDAHEQVRWSPLEEVHGAVGGDQDRRWMTCVG